MASEKPPRQNRVREALGRIYDQHPPLFREYLRRFEEDPTSRVFAPLAEAYRRMGRVDEAIEICREGLEHHPDFHGGRVALAKCLLEKRQFEQAKDELSRVVSIAPENLLAQRLLGDAFLALKDNDSALHAYKMALLLAPADVALAERVHQLEKRSFSPSKPQQVSSPKSSPAPEPSPVISSKTHASPSTFNDDFSDLSGLWAEVESPENIPTEERSSVHRALSLVEPAPEEGLEDAALPTLTDSAGFPTGTEDEPPATSPEIDLLLGVEEGEPDEDAFKIEHVSHIFQEPNQADKKEITTETLGDLYFSQGQFDRALRIFEKLKGPRPLPELEKKIAACRMKMGVDRVALGRDRQIAFLRSFLKTVQNGKWRRQHSA